MVGVGCCCGGAAVEGSIAEVGAAVVVFEPEDVEAGNGLCVAKAAAAAYRRGSC